MVAGVRENHGEQPVGIDRLGDVIDHAGFQARCPLFGEGMGSLADDGQLRRQGMDLACCLVAVHDRHLDVHQHDVEGICPVLADLLQRLQAVGRDGDLGTIVVEHCLHDFLIDLHVLGHQHAPAGERPARVERLGIPGFAFSDGPRGVVIGPATAYPVSMARGATWDLDLEERIGEAIGVELRAIGATLYGGVCVNVLRHPAWGRAQETYGEDPVHVGELGAALTRGVQRHAMACVKHFACNSMENTRFSVDVTVDEAALHEVYLPHFRRIVDEGVASVMSAYNAVNGEWCGQSRMLLTDVLRDRWGFEGFVISDWIFGLRDAGPSVHAGLDVEMPYRMIRAFHLDEDLAAGLCTEDEIATAVERVVATLLRFHPVLSQPRPPIDVLACDEHRALAREAAAKAVVLLRNEPVDGVPVLPLDPASLGSVAVIGRLAARFGIAVANSTLYTTMQPCFGCAKEIAQAKISEVVFLHPWVPTDVDPAMDRYKKAEYEKIIARLKVRQLQLVDPRESWAVRTRRRSTE